MEEKVVQGFIIGLIVAFWGFVNNSKSYSKVQKLILYLASIILPISVPLAIIFYFFNKNEFFKSKETKKLIRMDNSKDALKDLLQKELIDINEYNEKSKIIDDEKFESMLLKNATYINLKNLYESNILDKNEFDQKVVLLKDKLRVDSKSTIEINNQNHSNKVLNEEEKENKKFVNQKIETDGEIIIQYIKVGIMIIVIIFVIILLLWGVINLLGQ